MLTERRVEAHVGSLVLVTIGDVGAGQPGRDHIDRIERQIERVPRHRSGGEGLRIDPPQPAVGARIVGRDRVPADGELRREREIGRAREHLRPGRRSGCGIDSDQRCCHRPVGPVRDRRAGDDRAGTETRVDQHPDVGAGRRDVCDLYVEAPVDVPSLPGRIEPGELAAVPVDGELAAIVEHDVRSPWHGQRGPWRRHHHAPARRDLRSGAAHQRLASARLATCTAGAERDGGGHRQVREASTQHPRPSLT
jgi:hypothetical protein